MKVRVPPELEQAVDRWVLLRGAEAHAAAVSSERRARVAALYRAGSTRVDAALGEHGVPALILARAAIPCYLQAVVAARAEAEPPEGASLEALWAEYDTSVTAGFARALPPELTPAREHLLEGGSVDREIAEHGEARVDEAVGLATFLGDEVEIRTPRAIRVERGVRVAAVALLGVLILGGGVSHLVRGKNVALHAGVAASSVRPGSGPPEDLTNGKVEPKVAFATKDEPDPWVRVELPAGTLVREVTLVNSDDHLDDALPLRIETSPEGTVWEPGGVQTAHFTPDKPAVIAFAVRPSRFVRVHGHPNGAVYLTEIEIR